MWRQDERFDMVRSIPLFAGCSFKELARIVSLVTEVKGDPGEVLIREGKPGRESFVIVEGQAVVMVGARLVAKLGPGDFFGEMAVLGRHRRRTASVTAISPMRMLVLDPRQLSAILQIESVARTMLREVVDRFSAAVVGRPA